MTTITNILAYIDGRSSVENAATAAFLLATRHGTHVESLFVRTVVGDVISNAPIYATDGTPAVVEKCVVSRDREAARTEQRATETFGQIHDNFDSAESDAVVRQGRSLASCLC